MDAFAISNPLLSDPEALRLRADQDGYLFFRALIEPETLLDLRQQILAICAENGWLAPDAEPTAGIAAPGTLHIEGEPAFATVYHRVQKLEAFHTLAHHPALISALDSLFGEPTLVHPRNIARIIFPQAVQHTTPAHQDYIHIQGTEATWTAWIPLHDCPQQMGSLAVLAGSHHHGLYPVHRTLGAGGIGIDTAPLPYRWVAGDFTCGDVLLFHSMAVHRALPNEDPTHLRLSVDYRYQAASGALVQSSLEPHMGELKWEEIYAGWRSSRYQYYWQALPLRIVPWLPPTISESVHA